MRFAMLSALLFATVQVVSAQKFDIVTASGKVSIVYTTDGKKLDSITANLLANDIEAITGIRPVVTTNIEKITGNVIIIGAVNSRLIQSLNQRYFSQLEGKWESYSHKLVKRPFKNITLALVVAGSDARGTAYGVFSLSEKIGVSPWYWWADVHPQKRKQLSIDIVPFIANSPSVKYRGIFINDEDWGLQPWAAKTFEPETGDIGPKTYAKVFELLLRLKANLIWPAMHPSTKAFFHYPGNVTAAHDYQIVIGSSHAEPMLRNNVGEWDEKTMGHFNYLTNRERIYKYWEERVKESSDVNAIYTMGMRGVHDGQMEGIKNLKEAVPIVEWIIGEERDLLSRYSKKEVTVIPQVLTLYKEVLEIYDNGLKVPDDITLVWPDDNYGYIHRLNNENENARKGGSGVYYHASYWGRPHDYLWLSSTHPSLIREEMMKAYENGSDNLWVLNVGDIKPLEYNIQMFMNMAYNAVPFKESRYTKQHLLRWSANIFGQEWGQKIQSILWDYYQLAFQRKPEFMGWSQTEPETKTTYTDFNHFYYGDEAQKRLDRYNLLEAAVKKLRWQITGKNAEAFYQLVYYPVTCAAWMNKKFLHRDKAYFYGKQNRLSAHDHAKLSKAAYDSIVKETAFFNTQLAGGKWKHMMLMNPRNLAVYREPVLPDIKNTNDNVWDIAPEGYVTRDSSLLIANGSLSLPLFDNLNKQQYFIDIYLQKSEPLQWKIHASQKWIRLSKTHGMLSGDAGNNQQRIWVSVDWSSVPQKESLSGNLTFTAGNKKRVMRVPVKNFPRIEYNVFIEQNGFVSIHASNFSRQTNKSPCQWKTINGLGYTGNVLEALLVRPNTRSGVTEDSIKHFCSYVEYDFYSFTSAKPVVNLFALPSHPVNNKYRVRYAISIDDGPIKMVDIKTTGRSEEWKQNVLRNRAERKIEMPYLYFGKHTLKIYTVDPGVMLDEIRIDLGGLKEAYGTIGETKINLPGKD